MDQSNTLRRLENVLGAATENGDTEQKCAIVLFQAMQVDYQPQNIMDFYEMLNKAEEEALTLKSIPRIDRYIQAVEELHTLFSVNHAWGQKWEVFATFY